MHSLSFCTVKLPGLIALFEFDLVAYLFGTMTMLSKIVYGLVGLCGLYLLTFYGKLSDR